MHKIRLQYMNIGFIPVIEGLILWNMDSSASGFICIWIHLHMDSSAPGFICTWIHLHLDSYAHGFICTSVHLHMDQLHMDSSAPGFICTWIHLHNDSSALIYGLILALSRAQSTGWMKWWDLSYYRLQRILQWPKITESQLLSWK